MGRRVVGIGDIDNEKGLVTGRVLGIRQLIPVRSAEF